MGKDLTLLQDKPFSAIYYEKAMKDIYGVRIWVPKKLYSRFKVLEDDLKDLGFDDLKDYAYTISNAMKGWCKNKGLKYVPYASFCGEFAIRKYAKVKGMKTVNLNVDTKKEELLYTELLVLRTYIRENLVNVKRMGAVIMDLRPVLDPRWLNVYDNDGDRPTSDALEILAEEYHIKSYRNINDVLSVAINLHNDSMNNITGGQWKRIHTMQISG